VRLWFSVALLTNILFSPALAADILQQYEKVIWINQLTQVATAYQGGRNLVEFPVLTGDDETTTEPGIYPVRVKKGNYYSRRYQTPMPFSIFFNYDGKKAIHEGEVPPPQEKAGLATHGCVHVQRPYIEWLYDWTEAGKTVVLISGWRRQD
jgi:lipoprotein-anchoring transpeptidase ErfK/SrfK